MLHRGENNLNAVRKNNNNVIRLVKDVPKSYSDHDCLLGINEKLLLNSCYLEGWSSTGGSVDGGSPFKKCNGWYGSRRSYRSVAYKTWTVGAARKLLNGSLESKNANRNGFISDSDSNLDDDQLSSCKCTKTEPVKKNNNCKFKSRDASGSRALEVSRRENAANLKINGANNQIKCETINVDREFRAVVDTFKDLQNFIATSKTNNSNKRPSVMNSSIYLNGNNNSICANCSSDASFHCRSVDNKKFITSFDNVQQAIQYVKNELTNLRQRDFMLLQQLRDIKSEIRSNNEAPTEVKSHQTSTIYDTSPSLPPVPQCLIILK